MATRNACLPRARALPAKGGKHYATGITTEHYPEEEENRTTVTIVLALCLYSGMARRQIRAKSLPLGHAGTAATPAYSPPRDEHALHPRQTCTGALYRRIACCVTAARLNTYAYIAMPFCLPLQTPNSTRQHCLPAT